MSATARFAGPATSAVRSDPSPAVENSPPLVLDGATVHQGVGCTRGYVAAPVRHLPARGPRPQADGPCILIARDLTPATRPP
ncbi:hypothetical protein GCM10010228_58840 [Streptomyces massasporeus]|nr:hypothetical protein GCM10010228_58840 [Streptomyces massasporeus]